MATGVTFGRWWTKNAGEETREEINAADNWIGISPILNQQDACEIVRGEAPRIDVVENTGEVLTTFREFGEPGTNAALGQMALATMQMHQTDFRPATITDFAGELAAVELAIDPRDGRAMMVGEQRILNNLELRSRDGREPITRMPTVTNQTIYSNSVSLLSLETTADPALQPTLQLSQQYADAGASVTVTATVKNLGRAETGVMTVTLYSGTVATGTVAGQQMLSKPLALNQSELVLFAFVAAGGGELISAEITTAFTETTSANNQASASLIDLPAPTFVSGRQK